MSKLRVGQRVKVNTENAQYTFGVGMSAVHGDTGVIIRVRESREEQAIYGVLMDTPRNRYHDLNGLCNPMYGYWFEKAFLLSETFTEKDIEDIL